MRPVSRPWGVGTLRDMVAPEGVSVGLPDGRWFRAVPEPYEGNLVERLRAAWWVLRGDAHAVVWPEPGDLERAMAPLPPPSGPPTEEMKGE